MQIVPAILKPNSLRGIRKRPKPVTLIVGIIFGDEVVLAADSQTTWDNSKRTDTLKIERIPFQDQGAFLIGQAGIAAMAVRTIEIVKDMAATQSFDDYRKPAELAEEATKLFKQEMTRLNNWESDLEFARQYFEDNTFGLLLGYRYQDKAYLYEIDSSLGIATRKYNYACSPCAKSDCYPGGQFVVPKGVLPDGSHVFWLTVLGSLRFTAFDSKLKGAGGRAFEPQLAPPCVEYGWTLGGAKNFFLMDARDAVTRSASSFA